MYDIQGTLLISGAVFLHICICGALMRPAPAPVPFPAPALASSAKLVLKERVILDRYPSAPPDASRDADIVHSYEPPKHMNGTSTEHENEKVEESSLISPPVKSNALNDPNASTSIPQTGSSTSKPLDYPVHSDAQPKNADSATISTRMNTLTTGNKSSWLRSTLRDYWNLIRVMHFFTFVLSVNIAIGSNMM